MYMKGFISYIVVIEYFYNNAVNISILTLWARIT